MNSSLSIDPELAAAVREWAPRVSSGRTPEVAIEPRSEGQRVKMTYLGVETGVLFAWGGRVARPSVLSTLDRLYENLSWRVTQPPA
ncbi:MAG: hypothetical protein U0794_19120 [Isosphaeraceae bacterium]